MLHRAQARRERAVDRGRRDGPPPRGDAQAAVSCLLDARIARWPWPEGRGSLRHQVHARCLQVVPAAKTRAWLAQTQAHSRDIVPCLFRTVATTGAARYVSWCNQRASDGMEWLSQNESGRGISRSWCAGMAVIMPLPSPASTEAAYRSGMSASVGQRSQSEVTTSVSLGQQPHSADASADVPTPSAESAERC